MVDVLVRNTLREINVKNVSMDIPIGQSATSALSSIMATLIAKNVNVIWTIRRAMNVMLKLENVHVKKT
jgi:hypothetical protein